MSVEAQTVVTLLLVAWAVCYVAWRASRTFLRRRAAGCGGCAKCPSQEQTPTVLVSVESLLRNSERQE